MAFLRSVLHALVMLVTVAVTVTTHNLAIGVVSGVLVAMVLFARRVARSGSWRSC